MPDPLKLVAVGQTPPPYGGQAVAIETFVSGTYRNIEVFHVRMGFSDTMADVGKLRLRKLWHLIALIPRILWVRFRTRARVLYYPPAGPDRIPVLRDVVILLGTRWAFDDLVFHFHAGGLSEIYSRLPRIFRAAFRGAYCGPALAIQPSDLNPPDAEFLGARHIAVVPGGVPDHFGAQPGRRTDANPWPVLLYVGVLRESKGMLDLVDACGLLRQQGIDFMLHLMGEFESHGFQRRMEARLDARRIRDRTIFLGSRAGTEKDRCFLEADVMCYPTFFESETFGLVLIEAMQFELPIVATRWRGVPSVVEDGENGYLVAPHDPAALAEKLRYLIENKAVATKLGKRGREIYLERFTEEIFRSNMERALVGALGGATAT